MPYMNQSKLKIVCKKGKGIIGHVPDSLQIILYFARVGTIRC